MMPSYANINKTLISWSGGKDIALASYKALKNNLHITHLLTMMDETGLRSRSHGLSLNLLEAQAKALNASLITTPSTWETYESQFIEQLKKARILGLTHAVFGDIDIEDHRLWEEKVSYAAQIRPTLPLWNTPRLTLVDEIISLGFKPVICTVSKKIPDSFLGRIFDQTCVNDLIKAEIDPCGEQGEFHTVTLDAPHFNKPILYTLGSIKETEYAISIDIIV